MIIYKTTQEYADAHGIQGITAKKRVQAGHLYKIESVKAGNKIAGYVDIYEANSFFANRILELRK